MVHREDAVIVNALVRQALVASQEVMGENGLIVFLNFMLKGIDILRMAAEGGGKTSEKGPFSSGRFCH